jgi:methylase of polypeptide subunit release factors
MKIERELKRIRERYFRVRNRKQKQELEDKDRELREKLAELLKKQGWDNKDAQKIASFDILDPTAKADWFDPEWMFGVVDGFDVVIGNPPYVSTKGVDEDFKKVLQKFYGFSDDLYNHFYFKGIEILRENGILAFISSKTFWTIQTKKNLRELILDNKLLQLVDTANPFESSMVDTCITIVQKTKAKDYEILFIDARNGLDKKEVYKVKDEVYKNVANNVFFIPTEFNLKIYEKLGKKVKELLDRWWSFISDSKKINKYKEYLDDYRNSLKAGDITLLGLITEGGVGIQTGDNGRYIGVLEGTKWAEKVRKERPEKLWNFIKTQKPKELSNLKSKKDVEEYLNSVSEKEIRKLFDELKEKYGRDIFGQGWLYRIVSKDEIADVESLSDDEKLNGIDGDKTFVPYDKGDRDGNRWWAPTPYYIDWSRENVRFLKENSGKKGEGMPVVRNPQFYFKEGFCWNNVTGTKIICRIKEKSVHSTEAMTFISLIPKMVSDKYLICLMNSSFFGLYKNTFLNITVHLTTGDAKEFPIIIPTPEQLKEFELIFDRAKRVQEEKFSGKISEKEAEERLEEIQKELDEKVLRLYGLE